MTKEWDIAQKYRITPLNDDIKKQITRKVIYVNYNNFFKYNCFDEYLVSNLSQENIEWFMKNIVSLLHGDFEQQNEYDTGCADYYKIHIDAAGEIAVSNTYAEKAILINDLDIKNKIGNMLVHNDNNDIRNRQVNLSPNVETNEEIMSSPTAELEHYDYLATLFKDNRIIAYVLVSGDQVEAHIKGAILARKYNSTCYIGKFISKIMPTDSVEHVVVTDQEVSI